MKVRVTWIFKEPRVFEVDDLEQLLKEVVRASDNYWAGTHTVETVEVLEDIVH